MKNIISGMILSVLAFSGSLFAQNTAKADVVPTFNHRIVALQPSVSYQYRTDDSFMIGFDTSFLPSWKKSNQTTMTLNMEARLGYSFSIDDKSSFVPFIGAYLLKDLEQKKFLSAVKSEKSHSNAGSTALSSPNFLGFEEVIQENPIHVYGIAGILLDYNFFPVFTAGIELKGLMGKITGNKVDRVKDISYGFHGSVPLTFHFGSHNRWDFRLEPIATLIKDYDHYYSVKTTVGYSF